MNVRYVGEAAHEEAARLREKLRSIRSDAGLLFIGVHPVPDELGELKELRVRLGVAEGIDLSIWMSLVDSMRRGEYGIDLDVFYGVPGASSCNTFVDAVR